MKATVNSIFEKKHRVMILREERRDLFAVVRMELVRWDSKKWDHSRVYSYLMRSGFETGGGTEVTVYGREYDKHTFAKTAGEFRDDRHEAVEWAQEVVQNTMRELLLLAEQAGDGWEGEGFGFRYPARIGRAWEEFTMAETLAAHAGIKDYEYPDDDAGFAEITRCTAAIRARLAAAEDVESVKLDWEWTGSGWIGRVWGDHQEAETGKALDETNGEIPAAEMGNLVEGCGEAGCEDGGRAAAAESDQLGGTDEGLSDLEEARGEEGRGSCGSWAAERLPDWIGPRGVRGETGGTNDGKWAAVRLAVHDAARKRLGGEG